MYVYACVCVRAGEGERGCFQNNFCFSFARNWRGQFGDERKRVVDFSYLFLQIKSLLVFPDSLFLLSAVAVLSVSILTLTG